MDKEYKVLINKALERFNFRLSMSGVAAEHAARDSLTRQSAACMTWLFTLTI